MMTDFALIDTYDYRHVYCGRLRVVPCDEFEAILKWNSGLYL